MHEHIVNAPSSSPSRHSRHDRDRSGSRPHDGGDGDSSCRQGHKRNKHPHAGEENVAPADETTSAASSTPSSPCRSPSRKRRHSGDDDENDARVVTTTLVVEKEHDHSPTTSLPPMNDENNDTAGSAHKQQQQQHSSAYHNRSASPSLEREVQDAEVITEKKKEEGEEESDHQGVLREQGLEQNEGENPLLGEGQEHADDSFRDEENWEHPNTFNPECRRTLRIEYWDRLRSVKERKWDHMDYIDATYPSREQWILQSVLDKEETVIEENMFPYNTPKGILHLTLWSRHELSLEEVEAFVWKWIQTERPEVVRWNLDENASRSINVYHSHVYVQVVPDEEVGPPAEEEEEEEHQRRQRQHSIYESDFPQQCEDTDKVPEEQQPMGIMKKQRTCQHSYSPPDDRIQDLEEQKTPLVKPQEDE